MSGKVRHLCFVLVLLSSFIVSGTALAQQRSPFAVPESLRSAVDFWVLIFAKYGKYQTVFHFRNDPSVIYSVVDVSELAGKYGGAKFEKMKESALKEESERIRVALLHLSAGNPPRNNFERRIERLFSKYGSRAKLKYREALEDKQIRSQTGIREKMREAVKHSPRYLEAIEKIITHRGLPVEVSRLPYVESSFNYEAYSSVGAAGIWQFMRSTGKKYMKIDNYIDERKDPIISTRAAAEYLSHAYSVLGAWPLAITSYNHGVNGVLRAARSVGSTDLATIIERYDGESFGFASKNFYTSFLAALEVEKQWRVHFPDLVRESPQRFAEIKLASRAAFPELAKLSGLSNEEFSTLNPALLKPITSGRIPVPAGFLIKVPPDKAKAVVGRFPGSSVFSVTDAPLIHRSTERGRQASGGRVKSVKSSAKKKGPVKKR